MFSQQASRSNETLQWSNTKPNLSRSKTWAETNRLCITRSQLSNSLHRSQDRLTVESLLLNRFQRARSRIKKFKWCRKTMSPQFWGNNYKKITWEPTARLQILMRLKSRQTTLQELASLHARVNLSTAEITQISLALEKAFRMKTPLSLSIMLKSELARREEAKIILKLSTTKLSSRHLRMNSARELLSPLTTQSSTRRRTPIKTSLTLLTTKGWSDRDEKSANWVKS